MTADTREAPLRPGTRPQEKKVRKCLTCGEDFDSTHAGNRMCFRCIRQIHPGQYD